MINLQKKRPAYNNNSEPHVELKDVQKAYEELLNDYRHVLKLMEHLQTMNLKSLETIDELEKLIDHYKRIPFYMIPSRELVGKLENIVKSYKINLANNDFHLIKGNTFLMGCDISCRDERPAHTVTVKNFYMCNHVVTQKEYITIMGYNPSSFIGDNLPVSNVSWYDAIKYCNELSKREDFTPCYTLSKNEYSCNFNANGYRLPTEAEWEYAAKGGDNWNSYEYSGSDDLNDVAWFYYNSAKTTHEIASKQANSLGLYDMSGNVWEWCWDKYDMYPLSPNKYSHKEEIKKYRVLRGGSWNDYHCGCRVSSRYFNNPSYSDDTFGFRIVRSCI